MGLVSAVYRTWPDSLVIKAGSVFEERKGGGLCANQMLSHYGLKLAQRGPVKGVCACVVDRGGVLPPGQHARALSERAWEAVRLAVLNVSSAAQLHDLPQEDCAVLHWTVRRVSVRRGFVPAAHAIGTVCAAVDPPCAPSLYLL